MCPVCKRQAQFSFRKRSESFELRECSRCCVQFWSPFKNPGAAWYEEGNTIVEPKIGRAYHKYFLEQYGNALRGKNVLDVGCGTGEFLSQVQKRGAEVWGMDIDAKALTFAKERFHVANVHSNLDFESPQFDIITCFETIEHVDDPLSLLQNIAGKLKGNGVLILSTPSRERMLANLNRWDFPYNHLTRWNKESLANVGSFAGLEIQSVQYLEGFRFLMEGMNSRFHSGFVKKAPSIGAKKTALKLGMLKAYIVGGIPALILWMWGLITRRKNGTMFTIWKTKK
jgi:ubiquinone/menaquinone biosynthesis C-methylase UbiE